MPAKLIRVNANMSSALNAAGQLRDSRLFLPVAFLAASLCSFMEQRVGLVLAAAAIASASTSSAKRAILVVLALVPYIHVFGFNSGSTEELSSIAILCAAAWVLFDGVDVWRRVLGSPGGFVLSVFAGLLIAHVKDLSFASIRGVAFMLCLVAIFAVVRFKLAGDRAWRSDVANWISWSILLGAIISAVFLYAPAEWLILYHDKLTNYRLAGVFDDANATGRYLVPIALLFVVRVSRAPSPARILLLCLAIMSMSAAFSKGAIGAFACGSAVIVFVNASHRLRTAAIVAGAFAILLGWMFYAGAPLQKRAMSVWQPSAPKAEKAAAASQKQKAAVDVILNDLRVGTSSRAVKTASGKTQYIKRSYSIWHTGQRDILIPAGARTVRKYFWWGIGYRRWPQHMEQLTGFPFISPHNGFLEVAGAYGILGGALYLLLLYRVVRSVFVTRNRLERCEDAEHLVWVTASLVALMAFEQVDVSTSLAATLTAVWFWVFLAIQEHLLLGDIPSGGWRRVFSFGPNKSSN